MLHIYSLKPIIPINIYLNTHETLIEAAASNSSHCLQQTSLEAAHLLAKGSTIP